jgi:hypothetical protein
MAVAHWPRRPFPSARPASVPRLEGAALTPLLEGVAENVALAPVSAFPRIWSVPVPPSLRSQALAVVGSVVLPREDKATAMRVLSLSGQPSASRSGPVVSRLIWRFQACVATVRAVSWVRRR